MSIAGEGSIPESLEGSDDDGVGSARTSRQLVTSISVIVPTAK
jgi:hypothetical protein